MNFDVEVVLKGRDYAITESVAVSHGDPRTWDEQAVRDVLIAILQAIARVEQPDAGERAVALRGFSWIVEPAEDKQVVIAIEIPMGAAIAGPFAIGQSQLDTLITKVLRTEREPSAAQTIH